jgi:quinol monooxygenase YgiN
MFIVQVSIQVKPEFVDAFIEATKDNASNSVNEPGVIRFDFLQDLETPTHFALYEVYYEPSDFEAHRETAHFQRWRDRSAEMMAEPRIRFSFNNILPVDGDWKPQSEK